MFKKTFKPKVIIAILIVVCIVAYFLWPVYHYRISRFTIWNPTDLTIEETCGMFLYYADNNDERIFDLWTEERQKEFTDRDMSGQKDTSTIREIRKSSNQDKDGETYIVDYKSCLENGENGIDLTFVKEDGQWRISNAGRG